MSKIKGQNFRLIVEGDPVPEAVSCSVTITGNTEDTSTKDSEGMYTQETIVSTSWSASVDSYQATETELKALVTVFNAAEAVTVGWSQTEGTMNRDIAAAGFNRSGSALLNDFSMQFSDRETVTVTSQYQGTGALT